MMRSKALRAPTRAATHRGLWRPWAHQPRVWALWLQSAHTTKQSKGSNTSTEHHRAVLRQWPLEMGVQLTPLRPHCPMADEGSCGIGVREKHGALMNQYQPEQVGMNAAVPNNMNMHTRVSPRLTVRSLSLEWVMVPTVNNRGINRCPVAPSSSARRRPSIIHSSLKDPPPQPVVLDSPLLTQTPHGLPTLGGSPRLTPAEATPRCQEALHDTWRLPQTNQTSPHSCKSTHMIVPWMLVRCMH